jgi:pimeloyl-ACP methyl ester carboxylesterase
MPAAVDLDHVEDLLVPTFDTKPTLVFVHGAFSDGASWSAAVEHLGDHCAYRIFANPLLGLATDGATLAALLQSIQGPIILVGHSYGGALLSQVGCASEAVKALVFVAALAPEAQVNPSASWPRVSRGAAWPRRWRRRGRTTGTRRCTSPKTNLDPCWRATCRNPTSSPWRGASGRRVNQRCATARASRPGEGFPAGSSMATPIAAYRPPSMKAWRIAPAPQVSR